MDTSSSHTKVTIAPLNLLNWETATQLSVTEDQEKFIPPNLHSIAESKFHNAHPYGIFYGEKMVGFVMYSVLGDIHWVNRIMVDREFQQKGIGRKALDQMISLIKRRGMVKELRTSVHRSNIWAQYLFQEQGFELIDGLAGDEVVMRSA